MADLDRFELFTHVAQSGSITQAATNLQLTKASVSKQIKKLEAKLGVDLFSRTGQRLKLTEQGEVLFQQCLRLKHELDNTRVLCSEFNDAPKGELCIAALDYFAQRLIYPRLAEFKHNYPDLDINFDICERVPDFENENIHIALGFSLVSPDDVIQRQMATTRHVMCASKDYLTQYGVPTTLDDLRQHRYIGHAERDEVCNTHLKPGHEIKIKPDMVFNNVTGMVECAKLGMGNCSITILYFRKALGGW